MKSWLLISVAIVAIGVAGFAVSGIKSTSKTPLLLPHAETAQTKKTPDSQLQKSRPVNFSMDPNPSANPPVHNNTSAESNHAPILPVKPIAGSNGANPAPSFTSSAASGSMPGFEKSIPAQSVPHGTYVEEEIFLPGSEVVPNVLGSAANASNPAQQAAFDNIAENYLNNLEQELASNQPSELTNSANPSAVASGGRNQSESSRLADEGFRAIVGNQEADRVAVENHIKELNE